MTIFNTVKGTVNTAVETIAAVTQTLVEKNRTNAKLNRLRLVMKSESELMNRAYIALGKAYYDNSKKGTKMSDAEIEKLFDVIEKSKVKIAKARECYRKIVDSQNDIFYGTPDTTDCNSAEIVDITVACSNESEYDSSPFEAPALDKTDAEAQIDNITVAAAQADEQPTDKLSDLKEELQAKIDEKFVDGDEAAEDTESPDSELF